MPALTTNVEFGLYANSGKIVLGYPEEAIKMKYLDAMARKFSVPIEQDLEKLIIKAIDIIDNRMLTAS